MAENLLMFAERDNAMKDPAINKTHAESIISASAEKQFQIFSKAHEYAKKDTPDHDESLADIKDRIANMMLDEDDQVFRIACMASFGLATFYERVGEQREELRAK